VDTLLKEEGTDMVLVFFVTAPFTDTDAIARRIKEATESSDKPVVVVVETWSEQYALIDKLRTSGLPVYEFAEDGARALAAMRRYAEMRDRPKEEPPKIDADRAAAEKVIKPFEGQDAYLPQVEAFKVLSAYGIPVPKVAAIGGPGDLAAAARQVGFPCVLKVDSVHVIHKSDAGGVVLNIADAQALDAAFAEMAKRFEGMEASYLLLEQKPAGHEIVAGVTESPGLGSLVMFGLGGIFVEVMKDVVFGVAPLSRPEAGRMVRAIKGLPVLEGIRGDKGVDLVAVEDLLLRVSRLAADFPGITEMDLNPVLGYPDGTIAVDVRMKVR
jgi:acetyltransferase